MAALTTRPRDRIAGFVAAVLVQLVVGYALVVGLAMGSQAAAEQALKLFAVAPPFTPPERPKPIPPPKPTPRPSGAASPPNLKAKPTQIVAPVPVVRVVVPSPVVTAPIAGPGAQSSAGAAPIRGPGFGAGGQGDGFGSGAGGDGDGGGAREEPPEQIGGEVRGRDFLEDEFGEAIEGVVGVVFTVQTNGRATDCEIERSSRKPGLDAHTCRLIEQRFRFRPARGADGRQVRSTVASDQYWIKR